MAASDPFLSLATWARLDPLRTFAVDAMHSGGSFALSELEYLFGLFSLLLGFILIEVLSGLMRTLRARLPSGPGVKTDIHVGWLTPMLGAFTMLNVMNWWGSAWAYQRELPFGYDTAIIGLILCSFYYFASSMIFPDDPRAWPDIDDWFWLHRRPVLACILAANLPWFPISIIGDRGFLNGQILDLAYMILFAGLILLAIFAVKRSVVMTALALLIVLHLSFIPLDVLHRHGVW
jgi:hypothetical protein